MRKLTGAEIVIECLLEQGADVVFGYPGGAALYIYDALYKYAGRIRHVLTSHEQGAAHAADGYARSSGRVGVVFATSGPGATNLVTGIAAAYMDSSPVVAITCNVAKTLLGKDSFQEVDIVGITMPITKHNFIVKRAEDIAPAVRAAFAIASSGRPGPVLIDITKDATAAECEFVPMNSGRPRAVVPTNTSITDAIELITDAKRPLICAGGGVISAGAADELAAFREIIDAPVTLTLMGLGAFSGTHPAFTGMIGMHGTKTTSLAVRDCDLLIAVGMRFSDRVTCDTGSFAKRAKIIHIDIDEAEIGKNVSVDCAVVGDAKTVLSELCGKLERQTHTEWMKEIELWKKEYPPHQYGGGKLSPQHVLERIYGATGGEALIVTEVGQHQMWTGQFYKFNRPRQLITSGGLGAMGFGLGAAIGAQTANPGKRVFNIAGDGCFHMNMNELATAVKQGLPIVEVIMNNNVLGMVRQWQKLFYERRFSHTTLDKPTDYDMLAKAFGAKGYTAATPEEFDAALRLAMEETGVPTVINCVIDPDMNALPIVPPGTCIENPILEMN